LFVSVTADDFGDFGFWMILILDSRLS